jgi:hypothetical protein
MTAQQPETDDYYPSDEVEDMAEDGRYEGEEWGEP